METTVGRAVEKAVEKSVMSTRHLANVVSGKVDLLASRASEEVTRQLDHLSREVKASIAANGQSVAASAQVQDKVADKVDRLSQDLRETVRNAADGTRQSLQRSMEEVTESTSAALRSVVTESVESTVKRAAEGTNRAVKRSVEAAAQATAAKVVGAVSETVDCLSEVVESSTRAQSQAIEGLSTTSQAAARRLASVAASVTEGTQSLTARLASVESNIAEEVISASNVARSQVIESIEQAHREQSRLITDSGTALQQLAAEARGIRNVGTAVDGIASHLQRLEQRLDSTTWTTGLDAISRQLQQLPTLHSSVLVSQAPSEEVSSALVSVEQQSVALRTQLTGVEVAFRELAESSRESATLIRQLLKSRNQDATLITAQQQQMEELTRRLSQVTEAHTGVCRTLIHSQEANVKLRVHSMKRKEISKEAGPRVMFRSQSAQKATVSPTVISPSPSPERPQVNEYEEVNVVSRDSSPSPTPVPTQN